MRAKTVYGFQRFSLFSPHHIYSVPLAHYVDSPPEPCKIGTQADSMHVGGKRGRQLCGPFALSCAWFYKHFSFGQCLKL